MNNIKKEDCYYYNDVRDMGGRIPTCNYYQKLGYCPCDDCRFYIKGQTVCRIVKQYIEEQLKAGKEIEPHKEDSYTTESIRRM